MTSSLLIVLVILVAVQCSVLKYDPETDCILFCRNAFKELTLVNRCIASRCPTFTTHLVEQEERSAGTVLCYASCAEKSNSSYEYQLCIASECEAENARPLFIEQPSEMTCFDMCIASSVNTEELHQCFALKC